MGFSSSSTRSLRAATLVLAAVVLLACAAVASAATSVVVQHDSYVTTEVSPSDGDGIIGPGDTFSLHETLHSTSSDQNGPATLTGVSGVLSSLDTSVATVNGSGSATFPDLGFGVATANNTPDYQVAVSSGVECGVSIPLSLAVSSAQGPATVPLPSVSTGVAGPLSPYDSSQVGMSIGPGQGTFSSSIVNVATPGRVKAVRVRIGHITEPIPKDVTITLTSPAGTTVTLITANIAANYGFNSNFQGTVFAADASNSIDSGQAPFTGSFRPEGDLKAFTGQQQQGHWTLTVRQDISGQAGSLDAWGADVSRATCSSSPAASFAASPDPQSVGGTVSFDGSSSIDPGAAITDYAWNFGDGSPVLHASSPTTSHAYAARGGYTAQLTITDSAAHTSSTTQHVSVTNPPTAALSVPSSPVAATAVTLDASASTVDPLGHVVAYDFDLDGSGNYATHNGTSAQRVVTFAHSGAVLVGVRVTDDTGATSTKTVTVNVLNAPPTAAFSAPATVTAGQPVSLDGSASSDPDGGVARYQWDLDGSGLYATDGGVSPTLQTSFATPGTYNVGLRVTDNEHATATVTHAITVLARPPAAAFTATPNPVVAGRPTVLDGHTSSSPDGFIATYAWDLDSSGQFATSSAQPTLAHTFAAPGTYSVRLRVTDSFGHSATSPPQTVTVTAPVGGGGGGGQTLPVGGDAKAGIATLSTSDLTTIVPGSDRYFATITGDATRTARTVARHGLWLNLLADRPSRFALTVSLARADAQRLHLVAPVRQRRGRRRRPSVSALVTIGSGTLSLVSAGQRPFDIHLTSASARALSRMRATINVLVSGAAVDGAGHSAALARSFTLRR